MGRLPKDVREDLSETQTYDPFFGTTTSSTHLAMVEVDPGTCGVRVTQYVVAEDCGKVINPLIVDGQVHGGVAQGIAAALLEEVVYDAEGQLLTGSLVDFAMPSAAEIPSIRAMHVESESPSTLGGYRGMGEGGTIGALAAVANAVSDALAPLGIEIQELPVTPERLHRLLEGAGKLS
jgi:carbon-monoxide dehydrogenase large subunit